MKIPRDGRPSPPDVKGKKSTLNKVNTSEIRKGQVPAPNPHAVVRDRVRQATLADLDLLVRHRRGMWNAIAKIPTADLDAADRIYGRWARI